MGALLGLISLVAMLVGIVCLVKPIASIKVDTRKKALLVLGGGFVLFIIGVIITPPSEKPQNAVSPTGAAAPPAIVAPKTTSAPDPSLPPEQIAFISAVEGARNAFRAAANEMAQGGVRAQRKTAICQALSAVKVQNWVGHIKILSSNNDGKCPSGKLLNRMTLV